MKLKSSLCFIYIIFVLFQRGMAQQAQIDSLRSVYKTAIADSSRSDALQSLAGMLYDNNPDSGVYYGKMAVDIAVRIKDKRREAHSCMAVGNGYMIQADYSKALDYYKRSMKLHLQRGSKKGAAGALNNIGLVFWHQSDFPRALNCFMNVMKLGQETGQKNYVANSLGNIGLIYWSMSDFKLALDYQLKCLKMREEMSDKHGMALALTNIGITYASLHNPQKALVYHMKAVKIDEELGMKNEIGVSYGDIGVVLSDMNRVAEGLEYQKKSLKVHQEIDNKEGIALALSNIGNDYIKMNRNEEALDYYLESKQLNEEIGDKQNLSNTLTNLCNNYRLLKQYKNAEESGLKAVDLGKEIKDIGCESTGEEVLYKLYKQTGQNDKSLKHYESFIQLRDSIYKSDNEKEIARKELQFTFDKKEAAQKMEQEKKDLFHSEQTKRQRLIIICSIGLLLVLIVFSVSLFKRFNLTRKQHAIIEEKNRQIVDSINYAKRLQEAILPPLNSISAQLPYSFILSRPKDIVSGDFYWMHVISSGLGVQSSEATAQRYELRTPNNSQLILIAAADCTGHGVPGALVSVVCSNALNRAVKEFGITEPGKILDKVRELVIETFVQKNSFGEKSEAEVKDGMDISLCSIQSEPTTQLITVQWAGAHNPLWYIQNNELKELKADKQPVSIYDHARPFTTHTLQLDRNDMLYLFTDGYADQFGGSKGKKLKNRPLKEMILSLRHLSMSEQQRSLDKTFEEWKGSHEQVDDVTIIGIKL